MLKDLKKMELIKPDSVKSSQDKLTNKEETLSVSSSDINQQQNAVTTRKRFGEPIGLERCMSENEIRVLFLGRNRVGKTSSIKTLCAKCEQSSIGGDAVYTHTSSGQSLKLIESPGFDDKCEEIQEAISKSVSDCSPGPHVIIIVLSVERFTPAAKTAMKHVQDCLGQNARKHTMILFTGVDNLEDKPIESFIQENENLRELIQTHGNRFHALNNRDISNETQVNELLKKINAIYEGNNKDVYTKEQLCPGSTQKVKWYQKSKKVGFQINVI